MIRENHYIEAHKGFNSMHPNGNILWWRIWRKRYDPQDEESFNKTMASVRKHIKNGKQRAVRNGNSEDHYLFKIVRSREIREVEDLND
jgi:hypothetical protein